METVGVIVAVLSFVYMVIWGQKSVAEILHKRKPGAQRGSPTGGARAPQIFISYSRKDSAFVERLAWDLKAAGLDVWYDLSGLKVGARWGKEIQKAIGDSRYFVTVLSRNSAASEWVEREFLFASQRQLKIVPILLATCELPMWAINLHYIDMRGAEYGRQLPILLAALHVGDEEDGRHTQGVAVPAKPEGSAGHPSSRAFGALRGPRAARILALVAALGLMAGLAIILSSTGPSSSMIPMAAATTQIVSIPTGIPQSPPTSNPPPMPTPTLTPILGAALSWIEDNPPSFETSFEALGRFRADEGEGSIRFENGAVILAPTIWPGSETSLTANLLDSPAFAVVFNFHLTRLAGSGSCSFTASDTRAGWREYMLSLWDSGRLSMTYRADSTDVWVAQGARYYDFESPTSITLLLVQEDAVVFVNGELASSAKDPTGRANYEQQSLNAAIVGCEYDDFKIWDLSEMGT